MTNQAMGYNAWAALAAETTYGTPATGTNAVQTITPSQDLTGGAFKTVINGITSGSLDHAITLVELNAALLAAYGSTLVGGVVTQNVLATGGTLDAGTAFTLTYNGIYASKPMPTLTFTADTVTGGTIAAASGTAGVAPTMVPFELMDESLELKQDKTPKPVLGTTSNTHSVNSKASVEGGLKVQGQFNNFERLLLNTFGAQATALHAGESAVWDHTFTRANALPAGLTVLVDRDSVNTGMQFQYPGCMVDKFTLTQNVEDMAEFNFDLVGQGQENIVYPVAKPSAHAFNQIDYTMATSVTLGGVSLEAKSVEITVENTLDKDRYKLGSNLRKNIQRGGVVKVTGKITLEFESFAQVLLFEQYAQFQVIATWTGPLVSGSAVPTPFSLTVTMNNCALSGKTPNAKDWKVIEQELDFTAYASTVGALDEISAVLTNDVQTMI